MTLNSILHEPTFLYIRALYVSIRKKNANASSFGPYNSNILLYRYVLLVIVVIEIQIILLLNHDAVIVF